MSLIDISYYKHRVDEYVSSLTFYCDEIKAFEKQLQVKAAQPGQKKEFFFGVEHFQNQFILQKEKIDILLHDARLLQHDMTRYIKTGGTGLADLLIKQHRTGEKIEVAVRIFTDTKHAYYNFLAKHRVE